MKLKVVLPAAWPRRFERGHRVAFPARDVRLEVGQLVAATEIPADVHTRDVPPGWSQTVDEVFTLRTETGWKVGCVISSFARGGDLVEVRLHARYVMWVYAALAVVRAASRASFEACRPALLAVVSSARPGLLGGRLASVHELWKMNAANVLK